MNPLQTSKTLLWHTSTGSIFELLRILSFNDGVSIVPGCIQLHRMPLLIKSAATDFVKPTTAAFDVEYTDRKTTPKKYLKILTMRAVQRI